MYYESSARIIDSSNFVIERKGSGDYDWSSSDLHYINDENNLVSIPFDGISVDSDNSGTDYFILTSNEVLFSKRFGNNLHNENHLNLSHIAYDQVIGPSGKRLKNTSSNINTSKLIIGDFHHLATLTNNTLIIMTDLAGWNILETVNGDNIEISNNLNRYVFYLEVKDTFTNLIQIIIGMEMVLLLHIY